MQTKVKICGITNMGDAQHAVDWGADALGFVFWGKSPRYISPEDAALIVRGLPPFVTTVGVFVNEDILHIRRTVHDVGLGCVQLHGEEGPDECCSIAHESGFRVIKAVRVRGAEDIDALTKYNVCKISAYLLDTYKEGVQGGTGESFDWELAKLAASVGPIILSGGLNPENVEEAIKVVKPYAVDVSSGVEQRPGKKDPNKVSVFIERVRSL